MRRRALTYRKLVIAGLGHLFLNISCGVICFVIGVESDIDTALAVTVLCSHVLNLITLGEGVKIPDGNQRTNVQFCFSGCPRLVKFVATAHITSVTISANMA